MKKEKKKVNKRLVFNSKKFWQINLTTTVLLMLYFFLFIKVNRLSYYPGVQFSTLETFTDQERGGNSTARFNVHEDSTIDFSFQLGEKDHSPYAGINFNHRGNKPIDLSGFNSISIEFTPKDLDHMSLFLNVMDDNVKNKAHKYADRRMLADLYVDKKKGRQITLVSFDDTESPNWWYEQLDQSKKEFQRPDWSRLTSMSISNGINSEAGKYHEFKIHNVWFFRDYTNDFWVLGIIQVVVFVGSFIVLIVFKKKTEKVEISYKPVFEEVDDIGTPTFLAYIHQSFSDPDLSLAEIAKHTGVSPKVISDYIADSFDCNLKTYINQIRISEAKRLLKSSKMNINEVAFKVGFNSPGHFNRVFKNLTQKTPSEYVKD